MVTNSFWKNAVKESNFCGPGKIMVDVASKAGKHQTAWSLLASTCSNFEKLHKIKIYFSNHPVNKINCLKHKK